MSNSINQKKKNYLLFLSLLFTANILLSGQVYNPINYNFNGTPTYGIKIKTNLPFADFTQMPTLIIEGLNYGQSLPTGIILTWYIYNGEFWGPKISSFGADNPKIKLSSESGKVVIFIDERNYFQRFTIRAFAQGMNEQSDWFVNWQAVDEPLSGSKTVEVPYENSFKGTVHFTNGIWGADGKVGIGISTPDELLTVKGTIHATEVKVDLNGLSDFVFDDKYKLMPLNQVEQYVRKNSRLPEMPSAAQVSKSGLNMGDMQNKLLQKVEELTLYVIEQQKQIEQLKQDLKK